MSHILFISHARGIHGAEAVMVQAAKACAARGARVTVVVPSIVPDEGLEGALHGVRGVQLLALPYRAAGVHRLRTALVQLYNMPTLRRLQSFVKKEQVTVIYSNTTITVLGAVLAAKTGVRHIWHWHEPVDARFGWHRSLRDNYRRWAQEADTVVCISHKQLQEWKDALGLPLPNAQVVYNPIKRLVTDVTDIRCEHTGIRLGFIGHFEERKNLPLLLRVFEKLHAQVPETSLWLCGANGESDRQMIAALTELREPDVVVLPQTPDVASFYRQIDILVLPSWRETMPLVVLEAMQAGVCVLQTTQSGMDELLEQDKETLFFSPDDPDTLLSQLKQCMESKKRQALASSGKNKAMQLITNQSFDEQIQTILCE